MKIIRCPLAWAYPIALVILFGFVRTTILSSSHVQQALKLRSTLLRGGDPLYAVTFSPNSMRLASAGSDGSVGLWDVGACRLLSRAKKDTGSVWRVRFSPDGRWLASGSGGDYGTVRLWDARTGHFRRAFGRGQLYAYIRALAFSPDSRCLAVGTDDGAVHLWNVTSGASAGLFRGHTSDVSAVFFSPDGRRLVTASWDRTARTWNVGSGKKESVLSADTGSSGALALSPDGRLIATGEPDGKVRLWDSRSGRSVKTLQCGVKPRVSYVYFDTSGTELCVVGYVGAEVWNISIDRKMIAVDADNDASLSPDGNLLAVRSDRDLEVWDVKAGRMLGKALAHKQAFAVRFAPDSKHLATYGDDGRVLLWSCDR